MTRIRRRLGGVAGRIAALAAVTIATVAILATAPAQTAGSSAPFPGAVNVVPAKPDLGNCIPFGNNVDFGFSGFIYRNVPPFVVRPGAKIAFDLSATNDVDVRRDIYFSPTDHDPGPGAGDVRATAWTQVVSTSQVPSTRRGNDVTGDFELVYRAENEFSFSGGGLVIGFAASPPSSFADRGCEQVGVTTGRDDPSGMFYARFWSKGHLEQGILDQGTSSPGAIAGFVIFVDADPPVVIAEISPAPDVDGWIDAGAAPVRVTWTGVDDGSGIAACDDTVELTEPGVHVLHATCTDVAGNIGAGSVTVKIARRVAIDVLPRNRLNIFSANSQGSGTFLVKSDEDVDARQLDVSAMRFGGTGTEDSVERCQPSGSDLLCWFDIRRAALTDPLIFKAFADGVRVIGSDEIRLVGR